jgi:hypothetical protein
LKFFCKVFIHIDNDNINDNYYIINKNNNNNNNNVVINLEYQEEEKIENNLVKRNSIDISNNDFLINIEL